MNIITILFLGIIQMSCFGGHTNEVPAPSSGISKSILANDAIEQDKDAISTTISIKEEEKFKIEKPKLLLNGEKSTVAISKPQTEIFDSKSNFEKVKDKSLENSQDLELEVKESLTIKTTSNNEASASEINKLGAKLDIVEAEKKAGTEKPGTPDHSQWNTLLGKYVDKQGRVNYSGFKKDEKKLDEYLSLLAEHPASDSWSKNEQLAYWINVYNAFTIKLILKNYPVNSIMDINGGKAWDLKWVMIGNQTYSLNEIENKIIRPRFQEPRIHFAVNCAAKSCPPLADKAFTAENIESLLESQTIAFINDKKYNQISEKSMAVSKIFDWYKEDFGNLTDFINKYLQVKVKSGAKVRFNEYDWSLNN